MQAYAQSHPTLYNNLYFYMWNGDDIIAYSHTNFILSSIYYNVKIIKYDSAPNR